MTARGRRAAPIAIAVGGGAAVLLLSVTLFPHHSLNHDEAVYLQQAAMFLDGGLVLEPPVPGVMRPWFFVRDGGVLYPKYGPVPAGMFAVGQALFGSYRIALGGIAAANLLLVYGVVADAFDHRTGLVAQVAVLASPLFLIDSAVFLPYAPTFLWELLFAYAYLRGADGNMRAATVAGAAIGVAFLSRPYTAVLFALPFVVHALYTSVANPTDRRLMRHAITAIAGLAFVGLTLAYNAELTGSPLLFPYEAFAPRDGLGFGRRRLLGYSIVYTPALGVRAAAANLAAFATRWFVAGPIGAVLVVLGLAWFAHDVARQRSWRDAHSRADVDVQLVLAGLFVSVVVGEAYFWGTLNVLGSPADPADGLIHYLGPYYHFDLLLPAAAFGASGGLRAFDRVRDKLRSGSPERARPAGVAVLLVSLAVIGGTSAAVGLPIVADNAGVTAEYERAYAPFENRTLDHALVLLPTPYGNWLNHPFQTLRNEPDYGGDVVYAVDRGADNFATLDAFPDRAAYRYVYRGTWNPRDGVPVRAGLQPVTTVSGARVVLATTVGIPDGTEAVSIRVGSGGDAAYYAVEAPGDMVGFDLLVAPTHARLTGPGLEPVGNGTLSVPSRGTITIDVFLRTGPASGFSYREQLPVVRTDGTVRAITPIVEACRSPLRCGGEAAYIPNATITGVYVETRLSVADPA